MKLRIFILFFLSCLRITEAADPASLTTSLIIPCHYKHAQWLPSLLDEYAKQTVLPDEAVISLSESQRVSQEIIQEILSGRWPFAVMLIQSQQRLSAGSNRNEACKHASGDILICQDADDLPHVQRVEIIKYFFARYRVVQLKHAYVFHDSSSLRFFKDLTQVEWFQTNDLRRYLDDTSANGPVAIARELFEKIQWDCNFERGEDQRFNTKVFNFTKNVLVITTPLYVYRSLLSAAGL